MAKVAIVIPHHLPDLSIIEAWKHEFNNPNIDVIVIADRDYEYKETYGALIVKHEDIEKDLGKNSWIIPFGTSAIRSYGFYLAWKRGADVILTLDNDCYPEEQKPYWINGHLAMLSKNTDLDWFPVCDEYTRGFPYTTRGKSVTMVNHGLWSNVPDLDGPTMLLKPNLRFKPCTSSTTIPRWNFFPMCGMNLAFRKEVAPLMYFGLFGEKYGFDQFDDIWGGVLSKKVCDHLGFAVKSGYPSVQHRKQSNAFVNIQKQAPGMIANEYLWREVQKIELTKTTPLEAYEELITKLPDSIQGEPKGYFKKFKKAALIWTKLFQPSL